MYWLVRGAQSALFYYTSCTPCIEKARKRKIRAETKRERQDLQLYRPATLGEYHMQPEPFTTNPYWEADFACPSTPRPGRSQKRSRKRAYSNVSRSAPPLHLNGSSNASRNAQMSPKLRPQASLADTLTVSTSSTWDRQQNQREDDEVWGFEYTDGTFHTGPARPLSRSESSSSLFNANGAPLLERGASSFLSPPQLYGHSSNAQPQKLSSANNKNTSAPQLADINDMAPPVVAFPDEYQNGNAWFRQPPADRGVMRNTNPNSPTLSARSRPSTRGREPGLIRQVSNRVMAAQLQSPDFLALPGPALSRTSTQRSTFRRRATLEAAEEEAIPDILDDDYIPSSLMTAAIAPGSSHSSKSIQRLPQQKDSIQPRRADTSTDSTVVHNLPTCSSEDTSMDADVEDSDADSGIDIDQPSALSPAKPIELVNQGQIKRLRPSRTTTDPSARQRKSEVHGKRYLVTAGSAARATQHEAHGQVVDEQSAPRKGLALKEYIDNLEETGMKLGGVRVNGDKDELGDHELDDDEDPRWTWTRSRRWSADL